MKRFDFLICYDIANEKRVAKIGRVIEKQALRVQRSVYLYNEATKEELLHFIDTLLPLINQEEDDLRIYKITNKGIYLGSAVDLENPLIF